MMLLNARTSTLDDHSRVWSLRTNRCRWEGCLRALRRDHYHPTHHISRCMNKTSFMLDKARFAATNNVSSVQILLRWA